MDIIRLLPNSVANQIAAGEVVQRPSSVVKELMENAVDAGATDIKVALKNAGKTYIQVIDNGKGMSSKDALMAFERHATSKITSAQDIFALTTLGFRGEALPSIASVSEIELKTKQESDELGTYIHISASEIKGNEQIYYSVGTNIIVKDLFFNIPARRKFLKSEATELKNINNEFIRIALTNPHISFSLYHNDNSLYALANSTLRQRIVNIFGRNIISKLIDINCDTSIVKIYGYICTPEHSRKTYGEQYFFVNNRFIKHPFFHKAITEAYKGLINPEYIPSYFIYLNVDPSYIDINIHPTKTEVKFQNESDFFQIILATIKEALGKFNIAPSIDFDSEGDITMHAGKSINNQHTHTYIPQSSSNKSYNPFNYSNTIKPNYSDFDQPSRACDSDWQTIFNELDETTEPEQMRIEELDKLNIANTEIENLLQIKGRYISYSDASGLVLIDQKRAHERILYDKYLKSYNNQKVIGQKVLFPENIELPLGDKLILDNIIPELEYIGFELEKTDTNEVIILATPPDLSYGKAKAVIIELFEHYKNSSCDIRSMMKEKIIVSLAKASAMNYNIPLTNEEMQKIIQELRACNNYTYTADNKIITRTLSIEDINNMF